MVNKSSLKISWVRLFAFIVVEGKNMPHFGLMNEGAMGLEEGLVLRARLHMRGGKRRLRQGKISAGIVTLYDALDAAMQAYLSDPERKARLAAHQGEDLSSEKAAFNALVRSQVLDGTFDFDEFDRLTERALREEMPGFDYHPVLSGIENVMTRLGVLPFDEASLPAEDPATF